MPVTINSPPATQKRTSFQTLFRSFRTPEILTARYVSLEKLDAFDPLSPHIQAYTITRIPQEKPRRHLQQIFPKNAS